MSEWCGHFPDVLISVFPTTRTLHAIRSATELKNVWPTACGGARSVGHRLVYHHESHWCGFACLCRLVDPNAGHRLTFYGPPPTVAWSNAAAQSNYGILRNQAGDDASGHTVSLAQILSGHALVTGMVYQDGIQRKRFRRQAICILRPEAAQTQILLLLGSDALTG